MRIQKICFVGILGLAAVAGAFAASTGQLLADISGGDDHARALARQLLPRQGVEIIPQLTSLLGHEDQAVRKAASNVLEDLVNMATAPGRFHDRLFTTGELLRLLQPGQTPAIKDAALRLLPLVMPPDASVDPVARLLQDPDLREKARECLEHIGTRAASGALLNALPGADPAFARALVDAAGRIQDPSSIEMLRRIATEHAAAEVRSAALHALAWTGDPTLAALFRAGCTNADESTRIECERAFIRLAEQMGKEGGNWDYTLVVFQEILAETQHDIIKRAALMGLGRFGDETVVEPIVTAASGGNPLLQATVVPALEQLRGRAATRRILAAYPDLESATQLRMIRMFGRKNDPAFLPVLNSAALSQDAAFRRAALDALASAGSIDALPVLVTLAREGTEEERALALKAASNVAGSLGNAGDAEAAGNAFLELYTLADDAALRRSALEGLARYPVAAAHDAVVAALADEALAGTARAALPGLFGVLVASGTRDKALEIFDRVLRDGASPEVLVGMAAHLQGLQTTLDTTQLLGVIKQWHVIGPFQWRDDDDWLTAFVEEPDINLDGVYGDGDAERRWIPVTSGDALGQVDLMGVIGQYNRVFAYAYTEIDIREAGPVQIRIGSDDGNAVWLNGEKIWENRVDRGSAPDQDVAAGQLLQGKNRVLVKISQGAGGWNFMLRITRPDGTAPW